MVVPSYHYMIGPTIALLALGVLLLLTRWAFSSPPRERKAEQRAARADYGLLVPVAARRTAEDAEALRERLRQAGIRCTVAVDPAAGSWQLMVFRADAARASELVGS